MNPFELSHRAEVLTRRNAHTLLAAISRTLEGKPFCFSSNVGTGHTNRCLVVLRDQQAIEIIGTDYVTYRIPYRARAEVDATTVRVELHGMTHGRRIRWQFVVQPDNNVIGIPAGDNNPPLLPAYRTLAWPTNEGDSLRILSKVRPTVEVLA